MIYPTVTCRRYRWLTLGVLALSGCAQFDTSHELSTLNAQVQTHTGASLHWRLNATDAQAIHTAVQAQLAAPLTAEAAVQVALLASPQAQRLLDQLDLAVAERIQASRLQNPLLELARLNPQHEGRTGVEIALQFELLGVLTLPLRQRLAQANYTAAQMTLMEALLLQAAQVRKAYWRAQAAAQAQPYWRQIRAIAAAQQLLTERLAQAGNITALQRQRQTYATAVVQMQAMQAEGTAQALRAQLNQQMGLWGNAAAFWEFAPQLPPLPSAVPPTDTLEAEALVANLKRRALVVQLTAQAEQIGLTQATRWLPELELGYAWNREVGDGERNQGPSLGVQLPIFSGGSAGNQQAQAQLRILERDYVATTLQVRAAVQLVQAQLAVQWQAAQQAGQVLGPLAQALTQESVLHFNAMQLGLDELLQDKQREAETALQARAALRDYWLLHTDLTSLQAGVLPQPTLDTALETMPMQTESAGGH